MKETFIRICCAIALSVNRSQIRQCEKMIEAFDKEFKYWSATLMLIKKLCMHERKYCVDDVDRDTLCKSAAI